MLLDVNRRVLQLKLTDYGSKLTTFNTRIVDIDLKDYFWKLK